MLLHGLTDHWSRNYLLIQTFAWWRGLGVILLACLFVPSRPFFGSKNSIVSPDRCWAAEARDVQRHHTELMRIRGCLLHTWGVQLCGGGSTPPTFRKKPKTVCVVGDWEVPLLCGQLLEVLPLQGCAVALEDAEGAWAPSCLPAGSRAGAAGPALGSLAPWAPWPWPGYGWRWASFSGWVWQLVEFLAGELKLNFMGRSDERLMISHAPADLVSGLCPPALPVFSWDFWFHRERFV